MECGRTKNYCFHENSWKNRLKLNKDYAENFSETTGIGIQSQHWGGIVNYKWKAFLLNIFHIQLIQMLETMSLEMNQ